MTLDRLAEMFDSQHILQTETYHYDFTNMTPDERIQYIKDMTLAIFSEVNETLNEVSWKPWATSYRVNDEAVIGELVDVWHFMMNIMLALDLDPIDLADRFYRHYVEKNALNKLRQRDGYDGVSGKCRKCNRALDDKAVNCHFTPSSVVPESGGAGWCEVYGDYHVIRPREVVMTPLKST